MAAWHEVSAERIDLSVRPFALPFSRGLKRFAVGGVLATAGTVGPRAVLVSLRLVDASGEPVVEERVGSALRGAKVFLSADPRIGYYRYLPSQEGVSEFEEMFTLPDGVLCAGLEVRKFGGSDGAVCLELFAIQFLQ